MPARHAFGSRPEPPRPGLFARLRYRLDIALSRGSLMVIGYLAIITLAITVLAAIVLTVLHLTGINGGPRLGYAEAFWQSLLRMLGKGAFASDREWVTRVLALFVTLVGIFLAGALIALISASINQRVGRLRKGRSPVLETGHTLVLGWSPRLPVILTELVLANATKHRAAVVVLAERAKDEMEDELRRLVPDTGTTRVVCRTGDPSKPADLELVNIRGARSVIVLAGEEGDAGVVKDVLAVRSMDPTFAHIRLVAELGSAHHAETLRMLTDQRIATVQAEQVISQVTAQACHQNGLAGVFRDLLGFAGADVYICASPAVVGHTYRDTQQAFATSSVIGYCRAGEIKLNPPVDFVFAAGDEVIAISEDDTTVVFTGFGPPPEVSVDTGVPFDEPPQRIALVGWSALGASVLAELDDVLGEGSSIDLYADRHHVSEDDIVLPTLAHCTVNVRMVPARAESLHALISEREYDEAIVLGYRQHMSATQADAHTMLTLLAMHKAWSKRPRRPRVVAEMLDRSNVEVARTIEVDDFIVSDELSSLMLAQVSERLEVQAVFEELFDAHGCFVSLRPASLYAPDVTVSFASIAAAASLRGESAMGYRIAGNAVVLNPAKTARVMLGPADHVLVLSQRSVRPVNGAATQFPGRIINQTSVNGATATRPLADFTD